MMYGLNRGKGAMRRVAHLTDGEFKPALCGRPINMTANVSFARPTCEHCLRIANTTVLERVPALTR